MGRYRDVLLLLTFFTLTAPTPAGILGGQNNCFRISDKNLIITLEKDFREGNLAVSAYGDYATVRQVEILTSATWDSAKKSLLCYPKPEYASNCSLSEDGIKIILKLEQLFNNYTVQLRDRSSAGEQKTANPIVFSCSDSFDEPKQTAAATPSTSSEWMPILGLVVGVCGCILALKSEIMWILKQIRSKYPQWKNGKAMGEPDSNSTDALESQESTVHGNRDDGTITVDNKIDLKESLENTQIDLKDLKESLESTQIDLKDLKESLKSTQIDLKESLKSTQIDLKENLKSTQVDLKESLESTQIDLKESLESAQIDLKDLRESLESTQIDLKDLKESLESTTKDHADLKMFCSSLKEELEQEKKEKEKLKYKVASLTVEVGDLRKLTEDIIAWKTSRGSGSRIPSPVPGVEMRNIVGSVTPAAAAAISRPVQNRLSIESPLLYLGESVNTTSTGPAVPADGQVPAGAGKGTGQETFSSSTPVVPSVPSAQRSAGRTLNTSTGLAAPADSQVPAGPGQGNEEEKLYHTTAEVPSVPSKQGSAGMKSNTTHGDALESAMEDNYESFKNKGKQRGERPEIPPKPGCPPKSNVVPR